MHLVSEDSTSTIASIITKTMGSQLVHSSCKWGSDKSTIAVIQKPTLGYFR